MQQFYQPCGAKLHHVVKLLHHMRGKTVAPRAVSCYGLKRATLLPRNKTKCYGTDARDRRGATVLMRGAKDFMHSFYASKDFMHRH